MQPEPRSVPPSSLRLAARRSRPRDVWLRGAREEARERPEGREPQRSAASACRRSPLVPEGRASMRGRLPRQRAGRSFGRGRCSSRANPLSLRGYDTRIVFPANRGALVRRRDARSSGDPGSRTRLGRAPKPRPSVTALRCGAGTAGCILARRTSRTDGAVRILAADPSRGVVRWASRFRVRTAGSVPTRSTRSEGSFDPSTLLATGKRTFVASTCVRTRPAPQRERWFHAYGCRRWLTLRRDTVTNRID